LPIASVKPSLMLIATILSDVRTPNAGKNNPRTSRGIRVEQVLSKNPHVRYRKIRNTKVPTFDLVSVVQCCN